MTTPLALGSMATARSPSAPGRRCSRPACAASAVVTLTYEYARSHVWLDDLRPSPDPHAYDLCDEHGGRVTVPQGWYLTDRRSSGVVEPLRSVG